MLQTQQPSPCFSQFRLRLADDEPQVVLGHSAAGIIEGRYEDGILAFLSNGEEQLDGLTARRNGRDPNFHQHKPREPPVSRLLIQGRGERVPLGYLDLAGVEHQVVCAHGLHVLQFHRAGRQSLLLKE